MPPCDFTYSDQATASDNIKHRKVQTSIIQISKQKEATSPTKMCAEERERERSISLVSHRKCPDLIVFTGTTCDDDLHNMMIFLRINLWTFC